MRELLLRGGSVRSRPASAAFLCAYPALFFVSGWRGRAAAVLLAGVQVDALE